MPEKSNLWRTGLCFLAHSLGFSLSRQRCGRGVGGSWSRGNHSQEAERSRRQCSACFLPIQSWTTAHGPQGAAHIQQAVLQLNLSGNILVGTSSCSHSDCKHSQVNHHSLPVCALQQRKLRHRRLTGAARTPGAKPMDRQTNGPQKNALWCPQDSPMGPRK